VLSYVIEDFDETFFRLANTYATTGSVLRCPETNKAVIVSAVNVFREDVEALHGFYVPTLLWSSLVQSFSVQQALRDTFGTDLLGEKSKVIGMEGCDEPSRGSRRISHGPKECSGTTVSTAMRATLL
jgi:hypothetical protein